MPLKDPLSPLHRSTNHGITAWTSLRCSKQVLWRFEVPCHKNARDDRENSFPALVHGRTITMFAICSL